MTKLPAPATLAAILAASLWTTSPVGAQEEAAGAAFAAPQLVKAGDEEMGSALLYPSPILLDIDGDGVQEMVIGGLRGYLSVSHRTATGWGPEARLKASDGKDLKFHNW
jgi:hypothetical protein